MLNLWIERRLNVNIFAAAFLLIVLATTPLAIGSHRPIFWLFNSTIIFLFMAAYIFMCHIVGVRMQYKFSRNSSLWAISIFFLISLCGIWVSDWWLGGSVIIGSRNDLAIGILRYLSYGCVFFLALQSFINEKRAERFSVLIIVIVSLYGTYGLLSINNPEFLFYKKLSYIEFATGPFINRNTFATYLSLGLVLSISYALRKNSNQNFKNKTVATHFGMYQITLRLFFLTFSILIASVIMLTGSRMGVFVALLGSLIVVFLRYRQFVLYNERDTFPRGLLFSLVGLTLVVSLAYIFFSGTVFFDRIENNKISNDGRWELFYQVIQLIKLHPVLGVGVDSFSDSFRIVHHLPLRANILWDNAHNTYLELWAELGVLLGTFPILVCFAALRKLIQRERRFSNTDYLVHTAISALILVGVHALVDFSIETSAVVYLFVILLALGLAPVSVAR